MRTFTLKALFRVIIISLGILLYLPIQSWAQCSAPGDNSVIISQSFNNLDPSSGPSFDMLSSGEKLTNTRSMNLGGPGWDFVTIWTSTGEATGPVTATNDSNDFIGVNSFGGSNAPGTSPDGTTVSFGTEHNFQFNDGDGELALTLEEVDLCGYENRIFCMSYWIADTGFESSDAFTVMVMDDEGGMATVLALGETELEAQSVGDASMASEWQTFSVDLDDVISTNGLTSHITILIKATTNSASENIFVDDLLLSGVATEEVCPLADCSELFFSEYVEGSGNNKYLEIYNPTPNTVNLADYQLRRFANGTSTPTSVSLAVGGTLASGEVAVFRNSSATIYGGTSFVLSNVTHNGDDAYDLYNTVTGQVVDIFGNIGNDPGAQWEVDGNETQNQTLRRNAAVQVGVTMNPGGTGSGAFTTLGTEWTEYDIDDVSGLGSHTSDCIEAMGCSITNLIVTAQPACGESFNENDSYFEVSFNVEGGSGDYILENPETNDTYTLIPGAATDGIVTAIGQASVGSNVPGGTYPVVVRDLGIVECQSEQLEITVPECPLDPTELCLGDIAITGFQSDNPDIIGIYVLKDIGPGTEISFTDNGWFAAGGFRENEGIATVTFSLSVACGTAIAIDFGTQTAETSEGTVVGSLVTSQFFLSASGDQIFAFQGDLPTADDLSGFLAAINFDGSGWAADATGSNNSALPCIFEEGVTSYGFSEADNGIFNCVDFETFYTPAALRALVYDPANWSFSSSPVYTYPADCFIGCSDCIQPSLVEADAIANGECPADGISLSVSGVLGDATEWVWYSDCCGGGEVVGIGNLITVFPEENTTYYVRGEGGCVDVAKCEMVPVEAIIDDVRPTISCGGLDRVEVAPDDACAVTIDLEVPAVDDNCGIQNVRWRFREVIDGVPGSWSSFMNNPNNRTFAVGSYEIQWRVRDVNGNNRRCKYTLDVLDETDPEVICTDITIEFNGQNIITWDLEEVGSASDACGIDDLSIDLSFATCDQIDEVLAVEVTAVDANGNDNSCTAYVTVDGLPCGWFTEEEMVDCEGEAGYTAATETFILSSEDCHNPSANATDEFAFIQTELCGNAEIVAQVTSISGNAFGWAGVTMRESNDPGSKSVSLLTNLGSNHRTEVRYTENGTTQFFGSPAMGRHWLKINRLGNQFRLFASFDGVIWFLKSAVSVGMDDCLQVGLVLNSYVGSGDMTATFDNVSVSGNTPNLGLQAADVQVEGMLNADQKTRLNPSISSSTAKETFTAFPNPTAGAVTLTIGGFAEERAQLLVLDSYGRQVQQRDLGVIEEGTIPMDLSTLPAGVYTIQLQLANGTTHQQRVILQPRP